MTEKATAELEPTTTETSETESKLKEVSETAESETSKTEAKETEEAKVTKPATYTEEEVERRAQAKKDKELKTVYAEMDNLKKSHADLTRQLQTREDDKDLKALFEGDVEADGEETAKQRDKVRRKFAANFSEYKENKATVEAKTKENETLADKLSGVERHQNARDFYLDLRDEGLVQTSNKDSIMKQLEECDTPREFELAKKGIRREHESKKAKKPFTPDSGRGSGGGGDNLDNLSARELLRKAHSQKK